METVDELLAEAKRQRLKITNLYQGTDDLWRCLLRDRSALQPAFEDLGL